MKKKEKKKRKEKKEIEKNDETISLLLFEEKSFLIKTDYQILKSDKLKIK